MEKSNILITLAFDDLSSESIDTEFAIRKEIVNILKKYHRDDKIRHFCVADNEVISERIKNLITEQEIVKGTMGLRK